jgi:hypothetical protein
MTIKTKVTWSQNHTDEQVTEIQNKLVTLMANNATNGLLQNDTFTGSSIRTWNTVEAAEAWIEFLNTFTPPPASAVIEQE